MGGSMLLWLLLGVGVFWSVGAYNRLVRLRSAALQAFTALDALMVVQGELLRKVLPSADALWAASRPAELSDSVPTRWAGLGGAAAQFNASLVAARTRPLDPDKAAALTAATKVLVMAWQRVRDEGHDLAGAPIPENLQTQWDQLSLQCAAARERFNDAVGAYNRAIAQFPAAMLAWLFGLQPARPL